MMISRRNLLKLGAAAGFGLVAPAQWAEARELARRARAPNSSAYAKPGVTRFVDELVKPPQLLPYGTVDGATAYRVYATERQHAFSEYNKGLDSVTAWAYSPTLEGRFVDAANFHYLGPTIEVQRNERISVEYHNALGPAHLFSIDWELHGPDQYAGDNTPRIVTHLHGGIVPPESDGYPEDHYPPGEFFRTYMYPNRQRAANIWYHDHSLGITRLNVAAGLAAFYFIRDNVELGLGLPSGDYELPIVIQDRTFVKHGPSWSLFYLDEWEEEYFADMIVVNGRIWPIQRVHPRKYRLRLLNGSNGRSYRLWLQTEEAEGVDPIPVPMQQIGNSGGFLPELVVPDKIVMAPAERADVIVDFSDFAGKTITMKNNAGAPFFDKNTLLDEDQEALGLGEIMQFEVSLGENGDTSDPPAMILPYSPIPQTSVSDERDFVYEVQEDPYEWWEGYTGPTDIPKGLRLVIHSMAPGWYANYLADVAADPETADWRIYSLGFMWDDIVDEIQRGAKCRWTFFNPTPDMHPLHTHLVNFEVTSRQLLASNGKLPILEADGDPAVNDLGYDPPYYVSSTEIDPNEAATKDTVKTYPGQATPLTFQAREFVGLYPFHCHIIDHEDHEMMRQYRVITGDSASG
jgi:spore coat protein A